MGSGKGGGGGQAKLGESALKLANISEQLFEEVGGVRREVLGQALEAFQTGGVGAQIPLIQQGVEQSQAALARALRGTEEDLARLGVDRSTFAPGILGQLRVAGQQQTSRIPTDIALQVAQLGGGLAGAQSQAAIKGQQASGQLFAQQARLQQAEQVARGQIIGGLGAAGAGVGSVAGSALLGSAASPAFMTAGGGLATGTSLGAAAGPVGALIGAGLGAGLGALLG